MSDIIDLTPAQVEEFIQKLSPAARFHFLRKANNHIEWNQFQSLDLEEVSIEDAEAGKDPGFKCPHCDEVFAATAIDVLDVLFIRHKPASVNFKDRMVWLQDNEDLLRDESPEHSVIMCPKCGEPVDLPLRWGHDHY